MENVFNYYIHQRMRNFTFNVAILAVLNVSYNASPLLHTELLKIKVKYLDERAFSISKTLDF